LRRTTHLMPARGRLALPTSHSRTTRCRNLLACWLGVPEKPSPTSLIRPFCSEPEGPERFGRDELLPPSGIRGYHRTLFKGFDGPTYHYALRLSLLGRSTMDLSVHYRLSSRLHPVRFFQTANQLVRSSFLRNRPVNHRVAPIIDPSIPSGQSISLPDLPSFRSRQSAPKSPW